MSPRTANPPTSPPTIAPVLLDFLSLDAVWVGDVVGAAVPEVEEEELVGLPEEEDEIEEEEEDFDFEVEVEADEAAELSRTARAIDLKTRFALCPLNVV